MALKLILILSLGSATHTLGVHLLHIVLFAIFIFFGENVFDNQS